MILTFGARDIGTAIGRRYLPPGYVQGAAGAAALGFRSPVEGMLSSLCVQQNALPGGANVNYIMRVAGADTGVVVTLDGDTEEGLNAISQFDVNIGDLVELAVDVGIVLASGVREAVATVKFQ